MVVKSVWEAIVVTMPSGRAALISIALIELRLAEAYSPARNATAGSMRAARRAGR